MIFLFLFVTIFNTGFMYLGIYNYKNGNSSKDAIIMIIVSSVIYLCLIIYLWYLYFKTRPKYYRNINIAYESLDV